MANGISTTIRTGQSTLSQGAEQVHTLIITLQERPGSVDRVVGLLRRRRASPRSLILTQTGLPEQVCITAQVRDSEVAIDQLTEQLRKLVDVYQVQNLTAAEIIAQELVLIKINVPAERAVQAQQSGAQIIASTAQTTTISYTGTHEQVDAFIASCEESGIHEIARSGSVALSRE
ncbi:acetolactate synthase small subunit [Tengunoibacter tsumagoiensis]|uniref:Acetolactate synthase small subunit n=1 Tax=Tengunoibacter tsumagoiensis TaxID=2014871 RepID=A0A402A223_9CHLR|nr:acetolactate synthase small subunit [Tengunoibacter tsumagoiensis]GCE13208.1 acetolactate synthase small subunit [Tengunoibacter tsumagoiensis]